MNNRLPIFLLKSGLAVVFLYAAVSSFLDPSSWVGFLPLWTNKIIATENALVLFSLFELGLALWVLSGFKTYYAALFSAVVILGIIVFNYSLLDIVFRDIAILFSALALASLTKKVA